MSVHGAERVRRSPSPPSGHGQAADIGSSSSVPVANSNSHLQLHAVAGIRRRLDAVLRRFNRRVERPPAPGWRSRPRSCSVHIGISSRASSAFCSAASAGQQLNSEMPEVRLHGSARLENSVSGVRPLLSSSRRLRPACRAYPRPSSRPSSRHPPPPWRCGSGGVASLAILRRREQFRDCGSCLVIFGHAVRAARRSYRACRLCRPPVRSGGCRRRCCYRTRRART